MNLLNIDKLDKAILAAKEFFIEFRPIAYIIGFGIFFALCSPFIKACAAMISVIKDNGERNEKLHDAIIKHGHATSLENYRERVHSQVLKKPNSTQARKGGKR